MIPHSDDHLRLYEPISVTRRGELTIERYQPDYNDLAWQCLSYLFAWLPPLGPDHEIAAAFRYVMAEARELGLRTVYANPAYLVWSQDFSWAFMSEARMAQRAWFGQFNDGLASAERVRRAMDAVHPIIRMLSYTGVLVIDGHHVRPQNWPVRPTREQRPVPEPRIARIELGQRFKHLEVVEMLADGKYRCRCKCGNLTVKLRTHLLSGRTTSCGCQRDRRRAATKLRKQKRALIHTGLLPT
jgi:hypothetical protein